MIVRWDPQRFPKSNLHIAVIDDFKSLFSAFKDFEEKAKAQFTFEHKILIANLNNRKKKKK